MDFYETYINIELYQLDMQGCQSEDCFKQSSQINPNIDKNNKWSDELLMIESFNNVQSFQFHPNVEKTVLQDEPHFQDRLFPSISNFDSKIAKEQFRHTFEVINEDQPKPSAKKIAKLGCKCKKTECLKSYCQCYSEGKFCEANCGCMGCKNNIENKDIVENSKNKQKNKSNRGSHQCQCKKTKCIKKYCQCYNAGVPCGVYCKCSECGNSDHSIADLK